MITESGEGLVFLLGLPRSGTTLLSALLDDHPEIVCPPEPWIGLALDSIGLVPVGHPADARVIGRATTEFLNVETDEDVRTEAIRGFANAAYNARLGDASILIDKTPRYWHILDRLVEWFPDARFIHLRRDPFDVVASYLKTWSIDLADQLAMGVSSIHVLDIALGLHRIEEFAAEHADRVCTVSYEALVADAAGSMTELHEFLGVPVLVQDKDEYQLGTGVRRVTASALGDKSILSHDHVHTQSVGTGLETLSEEQLRTIYDTIGRKRLVSMGYKKTADELLSRGFKAPAAAKTKGIVQSSERMLAERWERCRSWSDLGLELPPEIESLVQSAQTQIQMATAERGRAEGEYARVLGEHDALAVEHTKLVQDRDALAAEHAKAVEEGNQLAVDLARLAEEHQQAIKQHQQLAEEHTQVSADHELLSKNYARSIEELDSLTRDYERSTEELGTLQDERDRLSEKLSEVYDDLQRTIDAREEIEARAKADHAAASSRHRFLTHEIERVIDAAERTNTQLAEAHDAQRVAIQEELDTVLERERVLDLEVHRVTNAYNHLSEQCKKRIFGFKPLKSWVRERCKRVAQICVWRAGPRPDREWPMVTVVTPCYNAQSTIRETIESVIGQGYPKLQYIIVDGGSTDGTLDVIDEYRDQLSLVISEPDNGMYDAIKKGFQHTAGDVMGYLNADDVFEPGGLWRVAKVFRDRIKVSVAYFEDTINTRGWRTPNAYQPRGIHFYDLLYGKRILFQDGVWWRPEAYRRVHGIDARMRYAGDYDLWLRMSMHYSFYRAPGHVSCFRKQVGQLSESMDRYWEEVEESKQRLRSSIRYRHILRRFPRWVRSKLHAIFDRKPKMFYPHNPGFGLPACEVRPINPNFPRCRLTHSPPDRLLFSTLDTRFGHTLLSRLWRCEDSDTVMIDPDLGQEELDGLYERYYSKHHGVAYPPTRGVEQLYAGYRGSALLPRLAERWVLPERIYRRVIENRFKPWDETSFFELMMMLRGQVNVEDDSVRFLDVGCFNGDLLDRLSTSTNWKTCGSETNQVAAQTARAKGHEIYVGAAEELWSKIPVGTEFDVVYLGQVIEHINDPYAFVRRIKTVIKPGGILVMTTPNLDSVQVKLYGPTWSHWHPPYHRVMFGRRGLKLLGERSGFKLLKMRSASDPGWTVLSQKLNTFGVTGAVPHDYQYTPDEYRRACSLTAWSRIVWDWRNRGDYLLTAFKADI